MRIKSIYPGAKVYLASAGPGAEPLRVGDEVGMTDAIRVVDGPPWPASAVEYEADGADAIGDGGRIGSMRIG